MIMDCDQWAADECEEQEAAESEDLSLFFGNSPIAPETDDQAD